jgi:hypothetical protein
VIQSALKFTRVVSVKLAPVLLEANVVKIIHAKKLDVSAKNVNALLAQNVAKMEVVLNPAANRYYK